MLLLSKGNRSREFQNMTDGFQPPKCKYTAAAYDPDIISEWRVFNILDGLRATATGVYLWAAKTAKIQLLQTNQSSRESVNQFTLPINPLAKLINLPNN